MVLALILIQFKPMHPMLRLLLCGVITDASCVFFFFQAEDGIRDLTVTGVQTCALPIYPDFLGKTLAVLEAVEAVAIVVSAVSGVDTLTQRLMEFARDRELCRLVMVNKIDSRDARCADVLAQLREAFGPECLPLNLPSGGGDSVVDCFFQNQGRATDFSSVAAAHTQIIDQVVELDEKLMALYLEQGEELSPEQLHDPFEQALREGHLVPVCFAPAESGAGLPELLQVFERLK